MTPNSKEMTAKHPRLECPGDDGMVCGLDELGSHSRRAPTHVVSILDPGEPEPSELASVHPDRLLGLRFHDAIERSPGVNLPSLYDVASILDFGSRFDLQARPLVHCHYGISRSTAAMAMLIALDPALTAVEVFARLLRIRPRAWPNSLMVRHADELLGRRGMLIVALSRLYSSQLRNVPEIAEFMRLNRPAETVMADAAEALP
jgi:predicted protein tyrosine phosphatase